jgi:hypothetical protein
MGKRTGFGWGVAGGAVFAAATILTMSLMMNDSNAAGQAGPSAAGAIRLEPAGSARQLPQGLCGASSEPMIERLTGNQAKAAALKEIAPALLRFPGGSQANFYDWKAGMLDFHDNPQSSPYVKFWAQAARRIAATFSRGVHLEDFMPFVREVGADVLLVPNLETSTAESQAEWFQKLASEGILPRNIELGNEFWIAMSQDPDSLRRWPDEPSSAAVMHRYEQALRPIAGPAAKFAVQAAGAAFWVAPQARGALAQRLNGWDAALHPESWFDAITIHLYPVLEPLQALPGGGSHEGLFRYLMARCDGGVDRTIGSVTARVPGKEIWITEWSAHGAGSWARTGADPVTTAMFTQAATRMLLSILRHPEVTRELFFTLNFDAQGHSYFIRGADGSYHPEPAAQILGWIGRAANSGARFQRVVEQGAAPVSPGVSFGDTYREVEGAVFLSAGQTTLILQNSGARARTFDPAGGGRLPAPKSVEMISTSDLNGSERHAVKIDNVPATGPVPVPPYSVMRVVWPGEVSFSKSPAHTGAAPDSSRTKHAPSAPKAGPD